MTSLAKIRARLALAFVLVAGCTGETPSPGGDAPAVEVIERTFVPRLVAENYWEPVELAPGQDHFVLLVHPRLQTSSEGPWTLTIRNADGHEAFRAASQRVDVATGSITLMCESQRFPPGDWTIELALEEGGRTSGPTSHEFRFRRQ